MKKTINSVLAVMLAVAFMLCLAACGNSDNVSQTGVWENAVYLKDTELGEGEKTVVCKVEAEDNTITFTVKTDKTTVGEALLENDIIAGEESEYGLYIKSVNGITADYDVDKSYWAFYIDGEYATSGVDTTDITEGATYSLVYTKE
ncbi:MAG: DUF4430 domain-containing protein [Clostridia bacterium]|nr:DUF4430 domain-containing protein [Clostridia bacterium]